MELKKEYVEAILNEPVQEVTSYRNQWIINTTKKRWVAKEVKNSHHLIWWYKLDQELRRRGFTSMPPFKTDQRKWVFTSYIDGRTGRYKDEKDIVNLTKKLATFHLTGQRLFFPVRKKPFLFYHRIYRRLVQFYDVLQDVQHVKGELGELLQAHGKDMYSDGLRAVEQLKRTALKELTLHDRMMGNIAHRDLASHNWIVDKNQKAWLIDWDTAEYDLQLGDFWQMSSRILTENNWEDKMIEKVLSTYQSIRPLSYLEKNTLNMLFSFPNEFYREAVGLAINKKGYNAKTVLPYLKRIISTRKQWQEQIKRLGNSQSRVNIYK